MNNIFLNIREFDIIPKVGRGEGLHDGEDCIIDAGQHHEEDPVIKPQQLLLRHEDGLTYPEEKHLGEEREEVPRRSDDISLGAGAKLRMGIAQSVAAPVKLVKLIDDEQETEALNHVGDKAGSTDNVVGYSLEILDLCGELCEVSEIHHGGRIQDEEILGHVGEGEQKGQDKHRPLGNLNKSLGADAKDDAVPPDEKDPEIGGTT